MCRNDHEMWLSQLLQKREREFEDYMQEKLNQARLDFRELLKETKSITYKYLLYPFPFLSSFHISRSSFNNIHNNAGCVDN